MPVEWMRHSDLYRELPPSNVDWIALDGDRSIGRVYQLTAGPEAGLWLWTMTLVRPGIPPSATNGRCQTRGEAGRWVVAAYERLKSGQTVNETRPICAAPSVETRRTCLPQTGQDDSSAFSHVLRL
jgi:hypothetical protein